MTCSGSSKWSHTGQVSHLTCSWNQQYCKLYDQWQITWINTFNLSRTYCKNNWTTKRYDQEKSVLSRWHSILNFLHDLELNYMTFLHFAENPIKVGHLIPEIWVNVGFEKQYLGNKRSCFLWWTISCTINIADKRLIIYYNGNTRQCNIFRN